MEGCDRCERDHDEASNGDRQRHAQPGRLKAGDRQNLAEHYFGYAVGHVERIRDFAVVNGCATGEQPVGLVCQSPSESVLN